MQEHLHPPRALLDRDLFQRVLEPMFLHRLEKDRRFVSAGVGEDRHPTGPEEPGHQIGEGSGILAFVEDVGGEDEVERSHAPNVRRAPVEEGRIWLPAQVHAGVVGREVEGCLVVVCRQHRCTAVERNESRQPDAASQLDDSCPIKVAFREVSRQGEGARPQLGPVREPFVAVEVIFVDQVVRRDGVRDAVRCVADLDGGFGQPGTSAEVGSQSKGVRGRIYQRPAGAASWAARSSRSAAARAAML
jgi:hypothetical protein